MSGAAAHRHQNSRRKARLRQRKARLRQRKARLRQRISRTRDLHPSIEVFAQECHLRAKPAKWGLLLCVAEGNDYTGLAVSNGTTSGALRAKVFRLRREIV